MFYLTVGQVAGFINVAVVIAQISFPLGIAVIIVGILSNRINAVTWSVASRSIQSSWWPTLLHTDSTATRRVDKRVTLLSYVATLGLGILNLASVFTPLGLSETTKLGVTSNVTFQYARDPSPMGKCTLSRTDYVMTRTCIDETLWLNCPGQSLGWAGVNSTGENETQTYYGPYALSGIPSNLTEIFTSATKTDASTLSSFFNIQFRSFLLHSDAAQGKPGIVARFHMCQSLILNERVDIVEGLLVDTKTGGIGFRNHTIPSSAGLGAEWEESILWIEPKTACVNTNLSLDYTLRDIGLKEADRLQLNDHGGMSNMTLDYPSVDVSDTQSRPELQARAFRAATFNNFNLMRYFNKTRSMARMGDTYIFDNATINSLTFKFSPNRIGIMRFPDVLIEPLPGLFPNGFAANSDYLEVGLASRGFGFGDNANISNIAIEAGLLIGAASRVGGSGDLRHDPGTEWTQPLFACATAVYASVKRVGFAINGTASLPNLRVRSVVPETYSQTSKPLWAVEVTGLNISNVSPFWGMVHDRYENSSALWTLRGEGLHLPAGIGLRNSLLWQPDSVAGSVAPATVLRIIYSNLSSTSSLGVDLPNYDGFSDFPLFLKWERLSRSAETAPTIINLIWTDIMANYVLGTKSPLSRAEAVDRDTLAVTVRLYKRSITYDLRYAIPAMIFLASYIGVSISACLLCLSNRAPISLLRYLLNHTSIGRAVTTERFPHRLPPTAATREWIRELGDETIEVLKDPRHFCGTCHESDEQGRDHSWAGSELGDNYSLNQVL